MRRREFLELGVAASGTLAVMACAGPGKSRPPAAAGAARFSDPTLRELADVALQAARDAGASYADVRISDHRWQTVSTREQRVQSIRDTDSRGFGVRVIANGTWGFAASAELYREQVAAVARKAVAIARANSIMQREPVKLAPVEAHVDTWATPIRRDPFDVPISETVDRLLAINAAALARPGVSFCSSSVAFVREHKFFASTEGSYLEQTLHRLRPGFTVTSVDRKLGSFQTRDSLADPVALGYEYFADYPWDDEVRVAADEVVAKHTAPSPEPGKKDLVLDPTHLWLTIHESIGHPTELDRALGMEANFAGTSFLTTDKLGAFRVGSELVSFRAEKIDPGALATCGYDDDGVKTTEWPLVERGVFVDYQTTRDQAHWIGRPRSYGCSYAQSWRDVPFQRMPNINLVPSADPVTLDDLLAGVDDGIYIKGRGSYSIDHQRYNFQFGGQTFYEIKGGKLGRLLKDVAYQASTPEFWSACDGVGGRDTYYVGGSFYDGKGEPSQSNAVSHGCPPARFRGINVLNTAREVVS